MSFRRLVAGSTAWAGIALALLSCIGCGFGAWVAGGFPDESEGFAARGNELECFVDIRPQSMPGVSSTTLSSRGPEMLSEGGVPLRDYRLSPDCASGFSFPTLEAAEADWRLFYSLRVNELVEEGDPLFAMEGGDWCEVPGTLRCVEREAIEVCRSMGAPFAVTPDIPLPTCEPAEDPFSLVCEGGACGEIAFGETVIGLDDASAPRRRVTLENSGGQGSVELRIAYDGSVAPVDGVDGLAEFRVEENECVGAGGEEIVVTAGNPCSFTVVFQPTVLGAHDGVIRLAYSYPSDEGLIQSEFALPVSGSAVAAPASCIDVTCVDGSTCSAIDFGSVELDQVSAVEAVEVSNCGSPGSPDLELEGPAIEPATAEFAVAPGSCGTTLAAGASCEYEVTFEPTTAGPGTGARSANLNVAHRFAGGATTLDYLVLLEGVAEAPLPIPGCLGVTCIDGSACGTIDFGALDVGVMGSPIPVEVANCGGAGAPDVVVTYDGATDPVNAGFRVDPGACFTDGTETLSAGGAGCEVQVSFAPMVAGSLAAATTFDYQFTGSAMPRSTTVDLSGTADGRILRVTPTGGTCAQDIVASGCTEPADLELRNAGTEPVTIDCAGFDLATNGTQCPGFVPDGGFQVTAPGGVVPPLTLGAGQTQLLRWRWCGDPAGEATALLGVASDDLTDPQIDIAIERRVSCP